MPRVKAKAAATTPVEPIKPVEPEEQVELDDPEELNDPEEIEEEEVEYEEVEEEIEEEEEEEVEEEEEEEEEDATVENGADALQDAYDEDKMKVDEKDDDESKKHAELLALPPHGSEVYVGSIPHDATEKDLKSFCETIGEVTEVRLMKGNDSKENKGYGFVAFKTKELASKAIEDLNNAEFMGRKIKVSSSQAKNKLFIGNVPRIWTEDDIRKVVTKVGPGVTVVELVKDAQNSSRNRGFAFIEYYNHACAEYSRKKMSTKFKLDSNTPTVSWADSKSADTTSQVKAVYVKNLPKDVTQDQLKDLFKRHGEVTKIILPPAKSGQEKSRYGFVHFAERSMAMSAIKDTEKYELDGQVLECSLAKPPSEKKSDSGSTAQKALLPAYPPRGYGLMGAGYGVAANYGVAPFGQPMMYGGAPAPAGVAMVPMVLPDGRLGYVLQQPGVPPAPQQRSGGNRGGNSSAAKQGGDSNRGGRRYRPY